MKVRIFDSPGKLTGTLRRIFILFLLFTVVVTIGSFILRDSIVKKMDRLSATLDQPSRETDIGTALLDLNIAENDFQQASEEGRPESLESYTFKLKDVFDQINQILTRYDKEQSKNFSGSKQQIAAAFQEKMAVSQRLFDLRRHFDSLIKINTISSISANTKPAPNPVVHIRRKTDTTVSVHTEANKSGLLRRLKDAISNKNAVKVLTIKQKTDAALEAKEKKAEEAGLLSQLSKQYQHLLKSNQELIAANLNLLNEVHQLLVQLQDIDKLAYQNARDHALREYRTTTSDLNTFTGITSIFLLIFVTLLIAYIQRAATAERNYQTENQRSIQLAGQKSEILAIMSHEIRNKLMAITGALFMLKKTELSVEQKDKVKAISLSSDKLIETVNNVLDVTKLEQKSVEILKLEPFSPFKVIDDAVMASQFMASNKGLELKTYYSGDIGLIVDGDQLRLSQIVTNLLSNAIKYTDKGHIEVKGNLSVQSGQAYFSLDISDTGIGIPKKSQQRLFTRYYQAEGKRPGTGLGLYLCKQLISLQKGTIQLESEEGKGCTVRFMIPYDVGSERVKG